VLATKFVRVVAVEPDDEMRRLHLALCPQAQVLPGSADQIPLADASVDAVFAAESFHWFNNERALTEIARVLRSRGTLVLIWNVPAGPTEPSIAAVERLLARHWPSKADLPLDLNYLKLHGYASGEWRLVFRQLGFEELQEARVPNPQSVNPDELVAFFASMGWIADIPDVDRLPLLNAVRAQLTATEYRLPWETHVYWTRLVEPAERP
jgi:SAM-dependent methyltransferase